MKDQLGFEIEDMDENRYFTMMGSVIRPVPGIQNGNNQLKMTYSKLIISNIFVIVLFGAFTCIGLSDYQALIQKDLGLIFELLV